MPQVYLTPSKKQLEYFTDAEWVAFATGLELFFGDLIVRGIFVQDQPGHKILCTIFVRCGHGPAVSLYGPDGDPSLAWCWLLKFCPNIVERKMHLYASRNYGCMELKK